MKTTIQRILGTLGVEEEKLRDMRSRYQVLFCQAEDMNSEVEYKEIHPQRKRKRIVDNWLKSFEELQAKVRRIEHDIKEGTSSSSGHMASRNQLVKITGEIEELMQRKKSLGELTLSKPANLSLPLVTTKLEGHMFREGLRRILSWLKNDRIFRIGVYGLGGVGKTALLMQSHNEILEDFNNLNQGEELFKEQRHVYWVTVLQECTVFRLQQKIATAVGLNHLLTEDDEKRRAAILSEGLKNVKGIVLFLDDMWEHFSLEEIGIPVGAKNFKYIISTRNAAVVRKMECQQILRLEPLVKEEAWTLFREKLGSYEKLSMEAKTIARQIAEECGGLPLGIKIMATSLTEVGDIHTWRDVLAELRNSNRGHPDMETKVLQALKVSFDYLKDVKLQQCFLLCALFPEDYQISRHELIVLMLSTGILEGKWKRQELIDKGHVMINILENVCLLEAITDVNQVQYVKMHDLVRDMAIRIAMDGHHCLIEANAELRKVQDEQEWKEDLMKVSLMSNCISEIPSTISPKCPKLSILLLQDNPLNNISAPFFNRLKNLQYLNLSRTNLERLPDSISGLQDLTALLLRHCRRLKHIPSLALLRKLRELDFSYCESLSDVPTGMDGLVNLKFLNLKGTKDGLSLQGLLPKLPTIQFLKLDYNVKGVMGEDLLNLEHLEGLEGWCTSQVSSFNQYVKSQQNQKLHRYDFVVGLGRFTRFLHELESDKLNIVDRNVRIHNSKIGESMGTLILPLNMQYLQIQQCDFSSGTLLDVLPSLNDFPQLMKIWIGRCRDLNFMLPATSFCHGSASEQESHGKVAGAATPLQDLKELILWDLPEMRELVEEGFVPPPGMFSNLKKLHVNSCPKIKSLSSFSLIHLQNLEELKIEECIELEELIPLSSNAPETETVNKFKDSVLTNEDSIQRNISISFPNLKALKLVYLPKLVSICSSGLLQCDKLAEIEISLCSRLQSLPISSTLSKNQETPSPFPHLQEIKVDKGWWESLEWNDPQLKQVLQPFVRFQKLLGAEYQLVYPAVGY